MPEEPGRRRPALHRRPADPPDLQPGRARPAPLENQQKISGLLRSETATRNRYAIRGYLDTARKHGEPVMDVIRDALTGNTWMPALPA
jgi:transposase